MLSNERERLKPANICRIVRFLRNPGRRYPTNMEPLEPRSLLEELETQKVKIENRTHNDRPSASVAKKEKKEQKIKKGFYIQDMEDDRLKPFATFMRRIERKAGLKISDTYRYYPRLSNVSGNQ